MLLIASALPNLAHANQCSSYIGRATINEVHRQGNASRFIEVKLLDTSIPASEYQNWTVSTCSDHGCVSNRPLSVFRDASYPWLVLPIAEIPDQRHIVLDAPGMEVRLNDANGDAIDYLSVAGFAGSLNVSCNFSHPAVYPGGNSHTIMRMPDGTGPWSYLGGGASGGSSEGESNQDLPPLPSGEAHPYLTVTGVTVNAGRVANFTVTINDRDGSGNLVPTTRSTDIDFCFRTVDDTAVAGTDYQYREDCGVVPEDHESVTVPVPTFYDAAPDTRFYLSLTDSNSAILFSHFARATIVAPVAGAVVLTANGQTEGPVTVTAGQPVTFAAHASDCGSSGTWREGWYVDGAQQHSATHGSSTCARTPVTRSMTFSTPGTYSVEFVSEYGSICAFGACLWWSRHGSDSIVINVVEPPPPPDLDCFADDFADGQLGPDWAVTARSGTFGEPRIVDGRLRLTDASNNVATAATLLQLFPGANNKVVLEFDYYAYGGSGADGVGVVFSDAAVTPQPGGYGGSLGYAQRSGITGFAGGWLGVGLDEYGNYSNPTEGRLGGSGFRPNAVAVRGSGNGEAGYPYLAGTGSLSPAVGQSGSTPGPGHRYRITIDHLRGEREAWVSVERDVTGTGAAFEHLFEPFDIFQRYPEQADVPENWIVSFTGSTGGSTNIHEIERLSVCAVQRLPWEPEQQIDHFRFYHDGHALTCNPEPIAVQACLDAECTAEVEGEVTAALTPTGWSASSFRSGDTLLLSYTTPGAVTLGVSSSEPPLKPLSEPRCYVGGVRQGNCSLTFHEAGFLLQVPDHTSAVTQAVTVAAVQRDEASNRCVPRFQNTEKTVSFWSAYSDPADGTRAPRINGTPIAGAGPGTAFELGFGATGEATVDLFYGDVGRLQLHARHVDDDDGLVMTGADSFVVRPASFRLDEIVYDGTANPATVTATGPSFGVAGAPFTVTVSARNHLGERTPNFGREAVPQSVRLEHELKAPEGGAEGDFSFSPEPFSGGQTTGSARWSEVGAIALTPGVASRNYLGTGDVDGPAVVVGRFVPARFRLENFSVGELANGCGDFTYVGQRDEEGRGAMGYQQRPGFDIVALNAASPPARTLNYTGDFARLLFSGGVSVDAPQQDAEQADASGQPVAVEADQASGSLSDNGDGSLSYLASGQDRFVYLRHDGMRLPPFVARLEAVLTAVADGDGVSADGLPRALEASGATLRYGRAFARDSHGTPGNSGDALVLPVGIAYFSNDGWQDSVGDACSQFGYSKTDSDGLVTSVAPVSVVTVAEGRGDLTVSVTSSSGQGGRARIAFDWPAWLPGPDSATARFGIFRGDDRFLYWIKDYD